MSKKNDNKKNDNKIKFRQDINIGEIDAMRDSDYLQNCFIQTEQYQMLKSKDGIKSILVGRTGTGKTAYMYQIQNFLNNEKFKSIEINVEDEFLEYLTNLAWLKKFSEDKKININLFFKNLWKHILTVRLIKTEFSNKQNFLSKIVGRIKKDNTRASLEKYIDSQGENFWEESYSTMEVIQKYVKSVEGKIGSISATIELNDNTVGVSREKIQDKITDRKQMNDLNQAMKMIGEYIEEESGNFYYLLIDKLDEQWIDDSIRYHLIRALIEIVHECNTPKMPIKVIIALRKDLIEKVYTVTRTRNDGFQGEKYHAFEIDLCWSITELRELIDERIKYMLTNKYSKKNTVGFYDIFPPKNRGKSTFDYLIERTLYRPRDIISFVNHCLEQLATYKKDKLTDRLILNAEREYSNEKFYSIIDEWQTVYENLEFYTRMLKSKELTQGSSIDFNQFKDIVENFFIAENLEQDPKFDEWVEKLDEDLHNIAIDFLGLFLKIGIICIKMNANSSFITCSVNLDIEECKQDIKIKIHPMLHEKFYVRKEK